MKTLIIDTALNACTVVAAEGVRVIAARTETMTRGHQERLAGMARDVMAAAGWAYDALDRIAVTTGPGSFTGLRVGLAFAQGLGLALDRPVTGLSTLEALAVEAADAGEATGRTAVWALIDARRGQVYAQGFRGGAPLGPPAALDLEAAVQRIGASGPGMVLTGSGAALAAVPGARRIARDAPTPEALAALAPARTETPARPLYLRAPDATPPAARNPS